MPFCFRCNGEISVTVLQVYLIPSELALAKVYQYVQSVVNPSYSEVSRLDKVVKV